MVSPSTLNVSPMSIVPDDASPRAGRKAVSPSLGPVLTAKSTGGWRSKIGAQHRQKVSATSGSPDMLVKLSVVGFFLSAGVNPVTT